MTFLSFLNTNNTVIMIALNFLAVISYIILAYISYMQVKASYRQMSESRVLRKIDRHNEQLREMCRTWRDTLLDKPPKISRISEEIDQEKLENEEKILFSDLKNHLPLKYIELPRKFDDYQELYKKYIQKQKDIIRDIKVMNYDLKIEFPYEAIYFRAIELETNKKFSQIKTDPYTNYLIYHKNDGVQYPLSRKIGDENQKKEEKEQFENVSNDTKNKCGKDLKELINIIDKIDEVYKECKTSLNHLILISEYDNMNCDFI